LMSRSTERALPWGQEQQVMINIAGLEKAAVLAALYNNAKIQGRGIHHPGGSGAMTTEHAARLLADDPTGGGRVAYEYLNGRVMKLDLRGDEIDPWLYDRDNGEGKAARVIDNLRRTRSVEEII
jgi:hypothetical protein